MAKVEVAGLEVDYTVPFEDALFICPAEGVKPGVYRELGYGVHVKVDPFTNKVLGFMIRDVKLHMGLELDPEFKEYNEAQAVSCEIGKSKNSQS